MHRQFSRSKADKVTGIIVSAALVILPVILVLCKKVTPQVGLCIAIVTLAVAIYGYLTIIRSRIVVDPSGITSVTAFHSENILFSDIKGYRIVCDRNTDFLELESTLNEDGFILNYHSFPGADELYHLIAAKYRNLDKLEKQDETKVMLQDDTLGSTMLERKGTVMKLSRVARWYSWTGYAIFTFLLFRLNSWSICLGLTFPLAGAALLWYSKGTIRFVNANKNKPMPDIYLSVLLCCAVLLGRAVLGVDLLGWKGVWIPALIFQSLLLVALWGPWEKSKEGSLDRISLPVLAAIMYGIGAVILLNVELDHSTPLTYTTVVKEVSTDRGRVTGYYLTLGPWGPKTSGNRIRVTKDFYNRLGVGDSINVQLYPGEFNIPWYEVETR